MKQNALASTVLLVFLGGVSAAKEASSATYRDVYQPFAGGRFRLGLAPNELVELVVRCEDEEGGAACSPERFASELAPEEDVAIAPFHLMIHEVSVGEYRRCEELGFCSARTVGGDDAALPVTSVEYGDAVNYCEFSKARLPTEHEFEFAMRGKSRRAFAPRGPFARNSVNAGQPGPLGTDGGDGFVERAPVLSLQESGTPEGVLHLSGNVEEWTQSKGTLSHGGVPEDGFRIVRGGHFATSIIDARGTARRLAPERERTKTRGFRCAR